MNKLTLEKIAQLAGVSRSTVSRVVNGHPSVKPEVRRRVQQVIDETGYHPDPAARSLAGQRSGIIGLVIPRAFQFLFTDPYYPRLMQGIAQACNTHNYILSLFLFHTEEEEKKLTPKLLRQQFVDGVILSALPTDDPLIPQLIQNEVPTVMIGRPAEALPVSYIDVSNIDGAFEAVSYLLGLGANRVAAVNGPQNTMVGLDRFQGYLNALASRQIPVDESLMVESDFSEAGGYRAMQQILPHQPNAVFVASDTMALGALRALREAGLSVPDDIAIVGFDDLPLAATADPPLTTVRQPIRRLGVQAVEMLIDLIQNGLTPPRHFTAPTELVIRQSCGAKTK
ncbi:MAG: LacI family DNA-binding transcriptional regulator [Anaerolineaceae bacterium]|nr:LacI family DNA-binding transcriptional regulator [Anaerolineaceae bacterium]MCB9099884.1 LacI family DNA-binding transcriptional regulator [Anaerolineales bacterium]